MTTNVPLMVLIFLFIIIMFVIDNYLEEHPMTQEFVVGLIIFLVVFASLIPLALRND